MPLPAWGSEVLVSDLGGMVELVEEGRSGWRFPAGDVHALAAALDEFEGAPLIIRSSSLLEDRLGTAFSGKYKSLFLANTGSKRERMTALLDAISEVYASLFGPDPIEYRRERGLIEQQLKVNNGSIKDTMAALGLPRKTLYDKMKKYRLERADYK